MTDEDKLMQQAWKTASDYMMWAKSEIDALFGKGYASRHPELVGVFMTTAAQDFDTMIKHEDAQIVFIPK